MNIEKVADNTNSKKVEIAVDVPEQNFNDDKQKNHFAHLFSQFKQTTINSLKWAGIKNPIHFSKIQTIMNFAGVQSRSSLKKQQKSLTHIAEQLAERNVDKVIISNILYISSELNKLEKLQSDLNIQLEDGLNFMGELENLSKDIPVDFEKFLPKSIDKVQKTVKIDEKTPKIDVKKVENELESVKTELKQAQNALKTAENNQKIAETAPKVTKLGPAGRIKKMFKIEHTMHEQQQEIDENLVDPARAFDEAFAQEKIIIDTVARQVSTPENIEKDLQPTENVEVEKNTVITKQTEKLATIGNMMKQVDEIKRNSLNTNQEEAFESQPEIIVENSFNPLNSLALLSKTERTMLFTLQN